MVLRLRGHGVVELVDDGGLDARAAFQAPSDVDDLLDKVFLDSVRRPELVLELGAVLVEVVGVFPADERVRGVEAMFECVL